MSTAYETGIKQIELDMYDVRVQHVKSTYIQTSLDGCQFVLFSRQRFQYLPQIYSSNKIVSIQSKIFP